MAQSFIPMLLLGPSFLLAFASSRAVKAADAMPTPALGPPRRPPHFPQAAAARRATDPSKATF
jgi:hypothetical protein